MLANWLACSMPWIYVNASYEALTKAAGHRRLQEEGWAIADLFGLAATAYVGRSVWWGMAIPMIYVGMLGILSLAWLSGLEYVDYRLALDASFATQLVVIFALGGGGACDWLRAGWRFHILPRLSILAPHLAGASR